MTPILPRLRTWLAVLLALAAPVHSVTAQRLEHACDAAAAKAERDWNVPAGVLSAVGTVESGRGTGQFGAAPWPWTINAAGRGAFFATKQEAIAAVLAIMARGYPYIDVGCFQIDIAYHPGVFRSLDDAFDPDRNAQAAAQILAAERLRAPDWAVAVARYHSATPGLGGPYLERVRAALPAAKRRASYAQLEQAIDREPEPQLVSPLLPRVIYPDPSRRLAREPQIVHITPPQALPRVVFAESHTGPLR